MELLGLRNRKTVGTTGASAARKEDGTPHLDFESHSIYRHVVGKLLWLVPIRPDRSYASQKLNRSLQ